MLLVVVALVLTAVLVVRLRREPRSLSNGLLLVATALVWTAAALSLLGHLDARVETAVLVAMTVVAFLTVLALVVASAFNGAVVVRREGLRPSTALPLAFAGAIVLVCLLIAVVVVVLERRSLPLWFLAIVWTGVLYAVAIAIQLVAFTSHALLYGRRRPTLGAASVVVLGCGLSSDGSVTPLLASRLDRAREVMADELAAGHRPALVVSGGQGTDETVPEAVAMQRYLVSTGIADEDVLMESASRTTYENLVLTRQLLDTHGVASEPMVVVTSDFHVLRAAAFTRDLGFDAQVTGARSARFYVPTAFLREFAAILKRYRKANAAVLLALLLVIVVLQHVN